MQKIGFVGVGRMGANMARRLQECGYPISAIYDAQPLVAEKLAGELNSSAVQSLAELTQRSEVIFTVVSDDQAMREIYQRPSDHLLMGAQGKLFINCATISPEVHVELQEMARNLGAAMLEAPMASSIPQARNGALFLMVAGDSAVYEAALPLLKSLSAKIVYTGKPGTAASLKALVNMVMNINTAALAEGLGLAEALGLDLNIVREVFAQTGANSRVLETDAEDMQNRNHETYFSVAHAAKDSRIAVALGKAQGLPLVLTQATTHQYEALQQLGLGDIDKSGISELTFKSRFQDHQPVLAQQQTVDRIAATQ
jgi:3-hydroxyisobutyrate dehydrogenase